MKLLNELKSIYKFRKCSSIASSTLHPTFSNQSLDEKITMCKLEYENFKIEETMKVPSNLTEEQWSEMAATNSSPGRRKFLRYLYITEHRKARHKEKQAFRQQISLSKRTGKIDNIAKHKEGSGHLVYGLWANGFLQKIGIEAMRREHYNKIFRAFSFGQQIIFDGSFTSHMNIKEQKNAALQLSLSLSINKRNKDPFYVHLCNFNLNDNSNKPIKTTMPKISEVDFPIGIHSSNYLDIFEKDKLVYLSPHAPEDLESYDHDAHYIIGYLVDLGPNKCWSSEKASAEGIKMKRLPLDKYLDWAGGGSKRLPMDQVFGILLELKNTGSWTKAFDKYIAKRRLKSKME